MDNIFSDPRHEKLLQLCQEFYRRIYAEESPENIHDWMVHQISKFQPDVDSSLVMDWVDSFELYDREIERRIEFSRLPEEQRMLFNWPWQSWNNLIDPIEPGILVVLSGPDGSGKTTYAECIAEHWARRGQKVAFVHFELSKIIMLDRRAVRHTAIARRQLKLAGDLTKKDLADIAAAKERLLSWPGEITYLHTPGKSIELVLRELARLKEENKCDVVIIDYLEKAAPSAAQLKAYGSNQYQREANDVELLKTYSEREQVPVFTLSQFSKSGKSVKLGDLDRNAMRGAGEKSEKANVVILLQPDKLTDNVINVKLDKNTLGPKGSWQQFIDLPRFQIGDMAK